MAHSNKNEVRLYFETHDKSPKEVAQIFGLSYRTIAHWIKCEGWQKAIALKNIQTSAIQADLLKKEFGSAMAITQGKLKSDLRAGLSGVYASEINESIKNAMLDEASEIRNKILGISQYSLISSIVKTRLEMQKEQEK